jgi:hypothetical protein
MGGYQAGNWKQSQLVVVARTREDVAMVVIVTKRQN